MHLLDNLNEFGYCTVSRQNKGSLGIATKFSYVQPKTNKLQYVFDISGHCILSLFLCIIVSKSCTESSYYNTKKNTLTSNVTQTFPFEESG